MSQQQARTPPPQAEQSPNQEPIKFGDVFNVSGELASTPIAPQDAATVQAAENLVLGQTRRSSPASVMQSAANINERAGLVGHGEAKIARDRGVSITKLTNQDGDTIVTEAVGGQVVGQHVEPGLPMTTPGSALDRDAVTIGEALEATVLSAGDKPVDQSDAAAIQAAEMRATGRNEIRPGGIGATAQSAATQNTRAKRNEDKAKLADVLADAAVKLPGDKPVTREDAEGVVVAELKNKPDVSATTPGGVAESMAVAARINLNKSI